MSKDGSCKRTDIINLPSYIMEAEKNQLKQSDKLQIDASYEGELCPMTLKNDTVYDRIYSQLFFDRLKETEDDQTTQEAQYANKAFQIVKKNCLATPSELLSLKSLDFGKAGRMLGSGTYGTVYKAALNGYGDVAVKIHHARIEEMSEIFKERDLMLHLEHERIVKLIGSFFQHRVLFVMELALGTLENKGRRMEVEDRIKFGTQLLEAVQWIHSKNIIHTDIKVNNILVTTQCNCKLADFGSALILKPGAVEVQTSGPRSVVWYLDLEANRNHLYSKKSDVFAAACCLFYIDKQCDLLRTFDSDQSPDTYARYLMHGRPFKRPNNTTGLELLDTRVKNSRFGPILSLMIKPRSARASVADILTSKLLKKILETFGIDRTNINCSQFSDEVEITTLDRSFYMSSVNVPNVYESAMPGIYYDGLKNVDQEETLGLEAVPQKTPNKDAGLSPILLNNTVQEAGAFLIKENEVANFIQLCNKNDSFAIGRLEQLIQKHMNFGPPLQLPKPATDISPTEARIPMYDGNMSSLTSNPATTKKLDLGDAASTRPPSVLVKPVSENMSAVEPPAPRGTRGKEPVINASQLAYKNAENQLDNNPQSSGGKGHRTSNGGVKRKLTELKEETIVTKTGRTDSDGSAPSQFKTVQQGDDK